MTCCHRGILGINYCCWRTETCLTCPTCHHGVVFEGQESYDEDPYSRWYELQDTLGSYSR